MANKREVFVGATRYYRFDFSNGELKFMTRQEAIDYAHLKDIDITFDGCFKHMNAPRRSVRDGFQAGYNPALGKHVGGPREHAQELKRAGLIEMGKEKPKAEGDKKTSYFTKDLGRDLAEAGMSDREIATMED